MRKCWRKSGEKEKKGEKDRERQGKGRTKSREGEERLELASDLPICKFIWTLRVS